MESKSINPIELFLEEAKQVRKKEIAKQKEEQKPIKDGDKIGKQLIAEENRFFIISMILLIVGCLGGTAVALGAGGNTIQTALLIFPVMATLSLILAVQPMRFIIISGIISVIIDIAVIVFNVV